MPLDNSILEMALAGYQLQRDRIDAAMAEIQAELHQGSARRSAATNTASADSKTSTKKRFSTAARKRMAAAQKKRWKELKAKKAEAAKPKRQTAVKRQKPTVKASPKQRPVHVKAVKKAAPKAAAKKAAAKVRKARPKPQAQATVQPVVQVAESSEATA